MFVTLGIAIWETPVPNLQGINIDGVLWFPDGKELYSEYPMDVEFDIGEQLILWRIRPDVKEGKGTPVVLSGRILRGLVPNYRALRLYVVEIKGGKLMPVANQPSVAAPESKRRS